MASKPVGELMPDTNEVACVTSKLLGAQPGTPGVHPPEGFLLVANNPILNNWTAPANLSSSTVVVRFNHCESPWPTVLGSPIADQFTGRELLIQRWSGSGYQGDGECVKTLNRQIDTLQVGHEGDCDMPSFGFNNTSTDPAFVAATPVQSLSTGMNTILLLLRLFPKVPIMCAGFDAHKDDRGTAREYDGHSWDDEARLYAELVGTGAVVPVSRSLGVV